MNYGLSRKGFIFAALVSAVALGGLTSAAQVTASLSGTLINNFPTNFYGANGQERNDEPWDQQCSPGNPNSCIASTLGTMNYGVLRFPAGTQSITWDWQTGMQVTNYGQCPGNPPTCPAKYNHYPSPLYPELTSEMQSIGPKAAVDLNLNIFEDPTCADEPNDPCTFQPWNTSTPGPGLPKVGYQMQFVDNAIATYNLNVQFVELGNEVAADELHDGKVYQTGTDYVDGMQTWISKINASHPKVKIGMSMTRCSAFPSIFPPNLQSEYQNYSCSDNRSPSWNQDVTNELASVTQIPNAFILHLYSDADLCPQPTPQIPTASCTSTGGPGMQEYLDNDTNTARMLDQPYELWNYYLRSYIDNNLVIEGAATQPEIWFTEYNLHDSSVPAGGSWAHGLYTATYSLLFANDPRVTLALHHEVQASTIEFEDIFSADGFTAFANDGNNYPPYFKGAVFDTTPYGLTAQGLTTQMINTAAVDQNEAQSLSFSGGPTFADGQLQDPAMFGEVYATQGSSTSQVIILNLSRTSQTVDLSGIVSGGTYYQIYGDSNAYVTGAPPSTKGGPWPAYHKGGDPAFLSTITAQGFTNPLPLPPYSITRIVATNNPLN